MKAKKEEVQENFYDVLIIGAGAAGLTAAIYASRYALKVGVIAKETGGLAAMAHKICNYPGFKEISGYQLMMQISEQVKDLGVPIINEEVDSITKKDNYFLVKTFKKEYLAKKIIFAAGMKRRKLDIPGEARLYGRGISYCATCDAGFFKNKVVAVVGGSDAALSSASLLADFAKKVYIIYRRENFMRAEPAGVKLIEQENKIESLFNEEVKEIRGEKKVESVLLKSGKELKLDGIFVEIGSEPKLELIQSLGIKTDKGFIETDKYQKTNVEGFYAAGDITNHELKQIVTAASQGAIAAYSCFEELKKEK
jgi:thioredoxin reductase (NADPH)